LVFYNISQLPPKSSAVFVKTAPASVENLGASPYASNAVTKTSQAIAACRQTEQSHPRTFQRLSKSFPARLKSAAAFLSTGEMLRLIV
jgi:hypothetical protein